MMCIFPFVYCYNCADWEVCVDILVNNVTSYCLSPGGRIINCTYINQWSLKKTAVYLISIPNARWTDSTFPIGVSFLGFPYSMYDVMEVWTFKKYYTMTVACGYITKNLKK